MNKKEIIERIEELKNMNKAFELLTDDRDEEELLTELEGLIDEVIFFYNEKLDELEGTVDIDQGFEYQMAIRENVAHRM
ncbi:hypothetical protein SAMN02745883_00723 [Caminicella sporogenes DSM 14501]|uniref:Uncharacterized protein n=1 Tax=Caminicella sporogenes DSM 14501 TaxID=1121266 RepID=A0A1M6MZE8_9FIRM|nr:hypothetical protein [Caminicella sporogenes]RKD22426.1 hypothetical protein BET04_05180 [Caminicella sporogenes]SHJ88867.1 hypothetical protein SAMN02745883_00723 [Caminicella sporogenes DSM 14501]